MSINSQLHTQRNTFFFLHMQKREGKKTLMLPTQQLSLKMGQDKNESRDSSHYMKTRKRQIHEGGTRDRCALEGARIEQKNFFRHNTAK